MKKIKLVIIFFFLSLSLLSNHVNVDTDFSFIFNQENDFKNIDYKKTCLLFLKAEKKLIKHRNKIEKAKVFVDPMFEAVSFVKIIEKTAPDLLNNISKHKTNLCQILVDNNIPNKDSLFKRDLIWLLYALPIDEYIDITDSLYSYYQQNRISLPELDNAILQNFHLSNKVAKNYNNVKLRSTLMKISSGLTKNNLQNANFLIETINDIISGNNWNDELKEIDEVQPPLFK